MATNLEQYYYHSIIRRCIIGFGSVFSNILVKRYINGILNETLRVPVNYGSSKKYTTRLQVRPEINEIPTAISLPRISFDLQGVRYDTERKLTPTANYRTVQNVGNQSISQYMPIPYNLSINLSILAKNQDDGLQILEQILPKFQPALTMSMVMVSETSEERDIPIVLNNVQYTDEYEGDYTDRSYLEWSLSFTIKTYLFGPVDTQKDIRHVFIDYHGNISGPGSEVVERQRFDVLSTDIPPLAPEEVDPKTDPYEITKTTYQRYGAEADDDSYFGL